LQEPPALHFLCCCEKCWDFFLCPLQDCNCCARLAGR
jgi:hypothetical protein